MQLVQVFLLHGTKDTPLLTSASPDNQMEHRKVGLSQTDKAPEALLSCCLLSFFFLPSFFLPLPYSPPPFLAPSLPTLLLPSFLPSLLPSRAPSILPSSLPLFSSLLPSPLSFTASCPSLPAFFPNQVACGAGQAAGAQRPIW